MGNKKRKVFTLDCETDPFLYGREPKPFIWGLYDGEKFETFETVAGVMERLYMERAVVFAHNGGRFDFLFLQDYFSPWKPIRLINGRIASFSINDCIFRDSFLILPTALKNYKKDKIDYSIMERRERNKPENREKILEYLEGDCRYLHELVLGFVKATEGVLPSQVPLSHISAIWMAGLKSLKQRGFFMTASGRFTTAGG